MLRRRSEDWVDSHTDLTERKQIEAELLRAHKLEALGVLAGGIAHDFNNLMAIVLGCIELSLENLAPDHNSRVWLLKAMQSVEQTKELTGKLITFSRGGGPNRSKISNVTEIIKDAIRKVTMKTDVGVIFDSIEHPWPVEIDRVQMKQCFYNLATNALEAMPTGGILRIQSQNEMIAAGKIVGLHEGAYLKITFTDEGLGIPEEHLTKIFDPYFTTKNTAAQKGQGLGLAVCYSVLKKHGGHITVISQPGKGTSFVLYIPARADLTNSKDTKKIISTGPARVLIMDDEPYICDIERFYLEQMGYEVTEVQDGQEAIDAYENALEAGKSFALVILDLTVHQGLGGLQAMEKLLEIDPSTNAIIASGYVDDPGIENYAHYGFAGALKKPFKAEDLKSMVAKILRDG